MKVSTLLICFTFFCCNCSTPKVLVISDKAKSPRFKKVNVDTVFRSESIAAGDINNDGQTDLVIGDVWYEAPDWDMHEIRSPGTFTNETAPNWETKSELPYYSNSFATQVMDVNKDGWIDVLVYPVMNSPIYWYENPKGKQRHWKERIVANTYHGESPIMGKLHSSQLALPIVGVVEDDSLLNLTQLSPNDNIESIWDIHTIGSTGIKSYKSPAWDKFSKYFAPGARDHGLGVGDIDGDGLEDVLTARGWYQSPQDPAVENWQFHEIPFDSLVSPEFPQYQFAQMPIIDIDQDGDNDLFVTSAHRYGLWWFENVKSDEGISFIKHVVPYQISQAHAVAYGDLNSNGIPDIVTGKRWLAHNGNDPGWDEPIELLWLEPSKNDDGEVAFEITVIDSKVGVGTQIELYDINIDGKMDILISNKKGTTIFFQN